MNATQTVNGSIELGEPVQHRGIVVAPLFPGQEPCAEYVTLEEAIALGFHVAEIDASGSVPELRVANPLQENVLLYDGEELLGAKQNRILNVTVLVAAGTETHIPVSCVERGRWSARSQAFAAARHAAYPELRRRKAERLAADPLAPGRAQNVVWSAVLEKSALRGVRSPTEAQADIYRGWESPLADLRTAFPAVPGQCGALFALGDQLCLDWVSRPEAFMRLYPKLLDGYLLDALERLDGEPAPVARLGAFARTVERAERERRPSIGLGEDIRLRGEGVIGSGLEVEGELVQMSAFSLPDGPGTDTRTSIARPSGRR